MRSTIAAVVVLALAGCNDVQAPTFGTLRVSTRTTSGDTPLGDIAYAFTVDNGGPQAIGSLPVTLDSLTAGNHSVALVKAPDNCTVVGDNPQTVVVTAGGVTDVTFEVACVATTGVVEVTTQSTGLDYPQSYRLDVDDSTRTSTGPSNGIWTAAGLAAGEHSVRLTVSDNCTPSDADTAGGVQSTHTVTVKVGELTQDTERTRFDVSCVATTGVLEVTTATSGQDRDPDGYRLQVTGTAAQTLGANGLTRFGGLAAGDHVVQLDMVASNCAVSDSNPRTLHITAGTFTRDTVRTVFQVACARMYDIAFARRDSTPGAVASNWITLANAQGSNEADLVAGLHPSWSPDGTRLVFTQQSCSEDYYYGWYCDNSLVLINTDSGGAGKLTGEGDYDNAAWSPDGATIAYASGGHLYRMNPDGSGQTAIPAPDSVHSAGEPAWSPDGKRIAFTCEVQTGWSDICLVNLDGTQFVRLTKDPWRDYSPSWSPDGASIAFTTNRDTPYNQDRIALISTDGAAFTPLAVGRQPSWSRDGGKIAFAGYGASPGLFVVNSDGTGLTRLTTGNDSDPAWRP
jgi:hypothetical protein